MITFNVKSVKVLFFQRCLQIRKSVFCQKTKQKDVMLKIWLIAWKGLFSPTLQFLIYPGSMMARESYKHWHQIMHFVTNVAMINSMIVITKDWLRGYRKKVPNFLLTRHKLFPTNEKNWNRKSSVFVLRQQELQG